MNTGLELIVDEPVEGHFYWTIVWRGHAGDLPRVIDYALGPLPTRGAATRAGVAALGSLRDGDRFEADELQHVQLGWHADTGPAALQLH